jgi:HPt (histidine-containing phosphotransfer) domain-containing protein
VHGGRNGRYLSKPIRTDEPFAIIENLAGATADTGENPPPASPLKEEVLDKGSIFSAFEGDSDLIREVVELFLEGRPRQMSAIREAVEHADAPALNRAAHSLKGSVSNFAAPAAFQAAQKLEGIGREGDLSEAGEAFRLLEQQVSLLQSAMDDFEKVCVA